MKKVITVLCLSLSLSGCASWFVRTEVVVRHEYIVRKATDEQKRLPPQPAPINVDAATQLTLAQWIVDTEARALALESLLKRLIEFYEAAPPPPITEKK